MGKRHHAKAANKRIQTSKLIDRLFLSSSRAKTRVGSRKATRDELKRAKPEQSRAASTNSSLKFGSFNVRGLDTEAFWFIEELINTRDFDVRIKL